MLKKKIILKPMLILLNPPNATKHHLAIFYFYFFSDCTNELPSLQHRGWLQVYGSKALAVPGLPAGCLPQAQISTPQHPSALHVQVSYGNLNMFVYMRGLPRGGCMPESCYRVSWHAATCYQTWEAPAAPLVWTYLMCLRSRSRGIFLLCQGARVHSQALVRLTYATVISLKNRQKADL